jgi:hypothetical protein
MGDCLVATETIMTNEQLRALLLESKRSHYVCEDCWYSCPESGECCDERQKECNCGAAEWNAKVDAALATPAEPRAGLDLERLYLSLDHGCTCRNCVLVLHALRNEMNMEAELGAPRREAGDRAGPLVSRLEKLAAGNITGCGTCTSILNEIRRFIPLPNTHAPGCRHLAGHAGKCQVDWASELLDPNCEHDWKKWKSYQWCPRCDSTRPTPEKSGDGHADKT